MNTKQALFKIQKRFFAQKINSTYPYQAPSDLKFTPKPNKARKLSDKVKRGGDWTLQEVEESTKEHVVYTWGATDPMQAASKAFKAGEGIHLIDYDGNKFIDLSSQAINNNLGYTVPDPVMKAITKQLQTLTMTYGGITKTEPKAKLAQILDEVTPQDITGFVFPLSGSEANECAIRMARRFTGKTKIMNRYKSYHGGTSNSLTATGDFRRQFAEAGISGFVKFYDFHSTHFKWGENEDSAIKNYLGYIEETIKAENPNTVAAIMMETVGGSSGVLINPPKVMEGIRALCDKYNILMILDEVMAGMGRCGDYLAFQRYEGLVPDIFTTAKGLSASFLPLSTVGCKKEIQDFFKTNALGWGTTYQAHPVSCICAYEVIKYMVENNITEHVRKLEPIQIKRMEELAQKYPKFIGGGRSMGLFGCFDLINEQGNPIQENFTDPIPQRIADLKKELLKNGVFTWLRSPLMHIAPPLIITESQLNDLFDRVDRSIGAVYK